MVAPAGCNMYALVSCMLRTQTICAGQCDFCVVLVQALVVMSHLTRTCIGRFRQKREMGVQHERLAWVMLVACAGCRLETPAVLTITELRYSNMHVVCLCLAVCWLLHRAQHCSCLCPIVRCCRSIQAVYIHINIYTYVWANTAMELAAAVVVCLVTLLFLEGP